jgi:enoyl-[acyl-carrier-protein] reductase (NADH)
MQVIEAAGAQIWALLSNPHCDALEQKCREVITRADALAALDAEDQKMYEEERHTLKETHDKIHEFIAIIQNAIKNKEAVREILETHKQEYEEATEKLKRAAAIVYQLSEVQNEMVLLFAAATGENHDTFT